MVVYISRCKGKDFIHSLQIFPVESLALPCNHLHTIEATITCKTALNWYNRPTALLVAE